MSKGIDKYRQLCLKTLFFLLVSSWASVSISSDVIAHAGSSPLSLSVANIRHIFFMRVREWPDGTAIKVFVLNDSHDLHKEFSKKRLGVFPYKLRRLWDRNVFSGIGQAPKVVKNEAEMIYRVSNTAGAIGYARKGSINKLDQGEVNVHFIKME